MQSFSITEAISFGFRMFVRNFWLLLALSLAGVAVQFAAGKVTKMIIEKSGLDLCDSDEVSERAVAIEKTESGDVAGIAYNKVTNKIKDLKECFNAKNIALTLIIILVHLLAAIFLFVLFMGWNRIALDLFDRGSSEFNRIFVTFPLFFSYIIGLVLFNFVVSVGLILLIVPGIIWALKYGFFDLMIVDTGCGPTEALRKSGELTNGHKLNLFLFWIIYIALIAISIITIIGPFILAYMLFLSRAYIFRTLQGKKSHA